VGATDSKRWWRLRFFDPMSQDEVPARLDLPRFPPKKAFGVRTTISKEILRHQSWGDLTLDVGRWAQKSGLSKNTGSAHAKSGARGNDPEKEASSVRRGVHRRPNTAQAVT